MIRTLVMIAVAGFLVSAVTLSVAVVLTGPDAIVNGAWSFGPHGWGWHDNGRGRDRRDEGHDDGPTTTREIAWSGGDSLVISVPAEVQYTQADGPAKIVVSGAPRAVAEVEVADGQIRFTDDDNHWGRKLKIAISAPAVTDFTLQGNETLAIAAYHQDKLAVAVAGFGDVKAAGEVHQLDLRISGSGHGDFSALKTGSAKVEISGFGAATVAPTDAADLDIAGSGGVTLLTNPAQLHTNITGFGRIHRAGQ